MNAPGRRARRSRARVVGSLVALLVPLAACSGGGDGGSVETPEQVLSAAKDALDQTSGVTLSLTTGPSPTRSTASSRRRASPRTHRPSPAT